MANLLVVDALNSSGRSLSETSVYQMDGADISGTFSQIGSNISTTITFSPTTEEDLWYHNSAIQIGRHIYVQIEKEIWRYDLDVPSLDWVLFQTISGAIDTNYSFVQFGLSAIMAGSASSIIGATYGNSSTTLTFFTINTNTDAYTEDVNTTVPFSIANGLTSTLVHNDELYFTGGAGGAAKYSYRSQSVTTLTSSPAFDTATNNVGLVSWNDEVYAWHSQKLYKLIGTEFTEVYDSGDAATTNIKTRSRPAMWVYNGQLYVLYLQGASAGAAGWKLLRFSEGTGATLDSDLTSILDSNLISGSSPGESGRFSVYLDSTLNPGFPYVNLYYLASNTQGSDVIDHYTFFGNADYIGTGAPLSPSFVFNSSGASNTLMIPRSTDSSGAYAYVENGSVKVESVTFSTNSVDISFRVFGYSNQYAIELYYSVNSESPDFKGTISSLTDTVVDDTLFGVSPDGSLLTFTWESELDGIGSGDGAKIALRAINDVPTDLTAQYIAATGPSVYLAWNEPTSLISTAISGYKIERKQSAPSSSGWVTVIADTGTTDTNYTDTSMPDYAVHDYRVSAIYTDGTNSKAGGASNEASVTVAFSPPATSDILGGTLVADFDASDESQITLQGQGVQVWTDGTGNYAVSQTVSTALQPLYDLAAVNGLNAVLFSPATNADRLYGSSGSSFLPWTLSQPGDQLTQTGQVVWSVVQCDASSTIYPIWALVDSATLSRYVSVNLNGAAVDNPAQITMVQSSSDTVATETGYVVGSTHVIRTKFIAPNDRRISIDNGVEATTTTSITPNSIDRFCIGAVVHASPSQYFSGYICQIIFADSPTEQQIAEIDFMLAQKWQ